MQANKDKVALFDFCETLAQFQTADRFVFFICQNYATTWTKIWNFIYCLLRKVKIVSLLSRIYPKSSINKRLVLYHLKGIKYKDIDYYAKCYYLQEIKPQLINPVVKEMQDLQKKGYRVLIVSAGYEVYLKYFAFDYNIPPSDIIAVNILFKNEVCSGLFDGGDRLWDKTKKLDLIFDRNKIETIAFSDSPTDEPLLEWADIGVVVRNNNREKWDKKNKYKEIIW